MAQAQMMMEIVMTWMMESRRCRRTNCRNVENDKQERAVKVTGKERKLKLIKVRHTDPEITNMGPSLSHATGLCKIGGAPIVSALLTCKGRSKLQNTTCTARHPVTVARMAGTARAEPRPTPGGRKATLTIKVIRNRVEKAKALDPKIMH